VALVELTENQLRILGAALAQISDEIEDDAEFEERIGVTRWEVEELRQYITAKDRFCRNTMATETRLKWKGVTAQIPMS